MENPLLKKFKIKEEYSVLLMNSNPAVHPLFEGVRIEYSDIQKQDFDSVMLFTKKEEELRKWASIVSKREKRNGQLWLNYPKKTAELEDDLTLEKAWKALQGYGFDPVRGISVNEHWSSMRIVRKEDPIESPPFVQNDIEEKEVNIR